MPSEIQMKCFLKVAARLSFTQAASELFITQQACSKYIAALEKELAFPLFIRSTRKVALTKDGKALYNALARFESEYNNLVRTGQQHYRAQSLEINFGLMNGTSPSILVDGVTVLKKQYPGIKLNWSYGEIHELAAKVQAQEIDIALMFHEGAEAHPFLLWKELFRFHGYVLLASHLTDQKDHIPYDILKDLPFAAHTQFGLSEEESLKEAKEFLQHFELPYSDIILFPSIDDSIASVETGESFTVTPPVFQRAYYVPYLNKYPLSQTAIIGCVWNPKTANPNINPVIQTLEECSKKSELYAQLAET